MRFRLTARPDARFGEVDYQDLGLTFALDASGELILGGGLGGDYAPDAAIVQKNRTVPLARVPAGAANVRGLWKTLIAGSPENLAPVVPEAQALRSLPIPASRPGGVRAN